MGFTSVLLGKTAHEALLLRQEAEMRLIENIKRCLTNKAKCDKEYAVALSAVATQGQKLDKCEELSESCVATAWRSLCAQWEARARRLRRGAEALEGRALERLVAMGAERRRARKMLQDEHQRTTQHFTQLSDEVTKKQAEYQKYLELYKQMRTKFEEQYIKFPARGGKKLEELRDKYQKACRKLHLTHNEYVLLLAAATECEKDLRCVQLPAVLARQRAAQDAFVIAWRGVLLDVVQSFDGTTDECVESQKNTEATIQNIKPEDEYKDLNEKYKNSPCDVITFSFEPSLVEDTSGNLKVNQLTVDNLTVEWLKNKLTDLETNLQENKEKQSSFQSAEIITVNGINKSSNGGSPTTNGTRINGCSPEILNNRIATAHDIHVLHNKSNISKSEESKLNRNQYILSLSFIFKRNSPTLDTASINSESRELIELKCNEVQWTKQADLLRTALSELGCEEAPSGCPDPATPPPSSPQSIPANEDHQGEGNSLASAATLALRRHLASVLPQRKIFRALGKPFRRKSAPCSPVPSIRLRTHRGGSEGPSSLTDLATQPLTRPLVDEEWFHGVLPREEVVRLLRVDGDFLVRETTRNDECQTVLSVCWGGHKHFIVQTTPEGHYRFEGPAFPSVRELILHQQNSGLAVTGRSGAILRRPVPRERWELNNDDVVLMEKIGRGNFGDVYKAQLKSSKQEVAVKTCRMTLPDEQKKTFLQEGRILKQYDHPNIVRLIGICVQKQPIMIVMELVTGGSLLTFLRNRASSLTLKQLLGMCLDAAAGMRYLESKNCIHRDLAARNCLVGKDHIVKISDFGMSREEEEYIVSGGMKQIPIKWTAPEALNFGKYTSLCDVWSYGILMWEIFAKGDTPYSGFSNSKAREKIDTGYRMPSPEQCPEEMYQLMLKCWEYDPEVRPHFQQIYTTVDGIFSDMR
ncbi:tyrosine-protein kinase Fer isoform X1 [Arctopsyche grandis]|uniref:tyrosine-protein kinase Fer isoform X1 n=1 Tax=Arctopsyche grandis TaxID=121162 RepID=UPI00406D7CDE